MRESRGWKAVVLRGVPLMWREVRRGFAVGAGGDAMMWWRERVADGPEESRRGKVGWKDKEVIADCSSVSLVVDR